MLKYKYFLFILMMAFLITPVTVWAQDAKIEKKLEAIDEKIKSASQEKSKLSTKTKSIEKRLGSLRERLIEQSRKVQQYQKDMTVLNDRISQIEFEMSDLSETLQEQKSTMSSLILTAQRLGRVPPQALLVRPDRPLNIARTGLLIKTTLPSIQEQSATLADQLSRMQQLSVELKDKRANLDKTRLRLNTEQALLESQINERQKLLEQTRYAERQKSEELKDLAKTSQNLKSLLDNLAQQPPTPMAKPTLWDKIPLLGSRGNKFVMPVVGKVVQSFGVRTSSGRSSGIKIDAIRGGIAVAPADGVVLFAGPFRQYKLLMIIQHPNGRHSLIGGLDEVYVSPKTQILAGEPIGKLKSGTEEKVSLYYELRQNGEPINPLSAFKS